jgi:hypothetical protein
MYFERIRAGWAKNSRERFKRNSEAGAGFDREEPAGCPSHSQGRAVLPGLLAFGIAGGAGLLGGVAHFLAMTLYFAERVDRLVLRFVVGSRDDFAQ